MAPKFSLGGGLRCSMIGDWFGLPFDRRRTSAGAELVRSWRLAPASAISADRRCAVLLRFESASSRKVAWPSTASSATKSLRPGEGETCSSDRRLRETDVRLAAGASARFASEGLLAFGAAEPVLAAATPTCPVGIAVARARSPTSVPLSATSPGLSDTTEALLCPAPGSRLPPRSARRRRSKLDSYPLIAFSRSPGDNALGSPLAFTVTPKENSRGSPAALLPSPVAARFSCLVSCSCSTPGAGSGPSSLSLSAASELLDEPPSAPLRGSAGFAPGGRSYLRADGTGGAARTSPPPDVAAALAPPGAAWPGSRLHANENIEGSKPRTCGRDAC
mmetsp:Transcript_17788/g.44498  ORF Transcript_17788/g.44498 Transcript_17788/m.44498 type:complete len:334 (-) Transcript_17788:850-1851(-)